MLKNISSNIITGTKYLLIIWIISVVVTSQLLFSSSAMLLFRFWMLPKAVVNYSVDFVPRPVREASSSNPIVEQVALVDLKDIKQLAQEDYEIKLELELPRTSANRNHGNFKITGMLANRPWYASSSSERFFNKMSEQWESSAVYNKVERVASLPYHSDLIENTRKLALLPFYVFGFFEEKSQVKVTLWNNAVTPLQEQNHLLISIPDQIWITGSSLTLTANLHGIRWLLQQYPILTFIIGSSIMFTSQITGTVILLIWAYCMLIRRSKEMPEIKIEPYHYPVTSHPVKEIESATHKIKNEEEEYGESSEQTLVDKTADESGEFKVVTRKKKEKIKHN